MRFNIDEKTVLGVTRHLREEGLLSQGARGVHAPHANSIDAARLLIALMVGRKSKDAVQVVRDFGGLNLLGQINHDAPAEALHLEQEIDQQCPTLEQAIAGVLDGFSSPGWRDEAGESWRTVKLTIRDSWADALINFEGREYQFGIPVDESEGEDIPAKEDHKAWETLSAQMESDRYSVLTDRYRSAIQSSRTVTTSVLLSISRLIAGIELAPEGGAS